MTYTRLMWKLTFTLVLGLGGLAVRPAQAQIPDNQITHGLINCRYWEQRNESWKLGYVLGFGEAATYSGDQFTTVLMGGGITYEEFVRGVDALCSAPENGVIPAANMLGIFTEKFQGASEATIASRLETDRKWYSRPVPPQKTGGKKQ